MTTGSQLTIYASRNQKRGHQSAIDWVLGVAKAAGVQGATVMEGSEGVDVHGRLHAARFFELADEPAMVVLVAEDVTIDALLATLEQGGIPLFYTRTPLEFGHIGGA
jgi:PII-like signaling protein